MDPEEEIYKPDYPLTHRVLMVACIPLAVATVWMAWAEGREHPLLYVGAVIIPWVVVALYRQTYRRIRLGQKIVAERYLLPPRVIEYAEIRDVGLDTVKLRSGHLTLFKVDNAERFFVILEQLEKRGLWSRTQIDGRLAATQARTYVTMAIAGPAAGVLTLVAGFVRPFRLALPWVAWFFIFYLPIALVTYVVLKRRST